MSTIGNYEDARFILEYVRVSPTWEGKPLVAANGDAPFGWGYVGSGSFRSVWRSPEGVAYKVQHRLDGWQGNGEEYQNLQSAVGCDLPDDVRLPEADLYEIDVKGGTEHVIAMELIHGDLLDYYDGDNCQALHDTLRRCESILGLGDLHGENAVVDDSGVLVIVDFGG